MNRGQALRVAVLGTGLIGIDLVTKIQRSPLLECGLVVGRDSQAHGLRTAAGLGCPTAAGGIRALVDAEPFDIVFDASNAMSHAEHWAYLEPLGSVLIDLTPSMVGHPVAPTVNGAEALEHRNVNLISCGGQAAIPILHALAQHYRPEYVEVVTTAATAGIGRATRLNLDEYVATTQASVRLFTGVPAVKTMVNVSPAAPPPPFRVAMSLLGSGYELEPVRRLAAAAAAEVRAFAAGYSITSCTVTDDRAFVAVQVAAAGDRLPRYAGNVDIINSAAVLVAEQHAARRAPILAAERS